MIRIPRIDTPITEDGRPINSVWFRFLEQLVRKTAVISTFVGDQTINATSGRFQVAAASTSVVITNNQVTADSIVLAQFATNDATGRVTAAVPSAGSFTVFYSAPTAQSGIAFTVAG